MSENWSRILNDRLRPLQKPYDARNGSFELGPERISGLLGKPFEHRYAPNAGKRSSIERVGFVQNALTELEQESAALACARSSVALARYGSGFGWLH
jgi:hypothetical protein